MEYFLQVCIIYIDDYIIAPLLKLPTEFNIFSVIGDLEHFRVIILERCFVWFDFIQGRFSHLLNDHAKGQKSPQYRYYAVGK